MPVDVQAPTSPSAPAARAERGVDPVEVVVGHDPRRDPVDAEVGRLAGSRDLGRDRPGRHGHHWCGGVGRRAAARGRPRSSSTSKRPLSTARGTRRRCGDEPDGRPPPARSCAGRPAPPATSPSSGDTAVLLASAGEVPEHGERGQRAGDRRQQLAERRSRVVRAPPTHRSARRQPSRRTAADASPLHGEDPDDRSDHDQREQRADDEHRLVGRAERSRSPIA